MWRVIAVFVSAALVAACGTTRVDQNPTGSDTSSSVPVADVERDVAESLAAAREKWSAAGLSTYSLELSPGPLASFDGGCGAGGSLLVQVVDGRVEEAIDQISGCRVEIADADRVPLTVEELFTLVENHLKAETLEIDFEPELGYPRSIFIRDDSGITEMSVMSLTPGEAKAHRAEAILAELENQRATWAENGSNTYTMVVEIGCLCPEEHRGPFEVTVVDGNIETVTMNDDDVEPADRSLLTVEELFSTIEDYAHSDEINVTYAPAGYPSTIDIDPDFDIVDEELFIDVHELILSGG